jgi:hypothetical protein
MSDSTMDHPLREASGILVGVLIGLPLWALVALAVWVVWRLV